jgi:SAM-dependent methyltransferase
VKYVNDDSVEGVLASTELSSNQVRVECDGRAWATVPAFADPEDPSLLRFKCQLPAIASPQQTDVRALDAGTGRSLRQIRIDDRQPKVNAYGLLAHDVLMVHCKPLMALPWMSFDGANLTISGAHLPPAGDPSSLQVRLAPGVKFKFDYPLISPQFQQHFWYWPNAHLSNLILTIDLPASSAKADAFSVEFFYEKAAPLLAGTIAAQGTEIGSLCGSIWIPRSLTAFVGFPREGSQVTRVQTWSDDHSVTMTGYNAFKTIEALLAQQGVKSKRALRLLDWGCGHGRVTRHFIANWPEAEIVGMDIDAENIEWCRQNLSAGTFEVAPLWPPSPIADGSIDAIFGISVMTHLTAVAQKAWLAELARMLKPQGLALITFAGPGGAAWSSGLRTVEWWRHWKETGFNDDQLDPALEGKIGDSTYYRNTVQVPEYTRVNWSDQFDIVAIKPDLMGNQDVAILRLR